MPRRRSRTANVSPHARYGVEPSFGKAPDYIEPFTAYRAWNWTAKGVTSLNGALWTPKVAFEATCAYRNDWKSMLASATTEAARKFWQSNAHHVPDPSCPCGMYAGINMQHMIDINYIQRGIHGEVSLWGRLYRHTLGWRAQFAYPKFFVVPMNMIPFNMAEAQKRLATLVEFDIDIYLQAEREARVGQQTIPLWVRDFGYSQQGLSILVEKRKQWYKDSPTIRTLAVGDRVAVFSDLNGGGIGIVKKIEGNEIYYTLFSPDVVYRKPVCEVLWNDRNWRWETTGLGSGRRMDAKRHQKCSPLGGDRCHS